eukprot:scaffold253615_cov28-Tisochrysis_lutea.AAC.1
MPRGVDEWMLRCSAGNICGRTDVKLHGEARILRLFHSGIAWPNSHVMRTRPQDVPSLIIHSNF